MTLETCPITWRVRLATRPLVSPVLIGDLVVVAEGGNLHAFARTDGAPAWTRPLTGKISHLVAAGDGCVAVARDRGRDRIVLVDGKGAERWAIDGWTVQPRAVGADRERVAVAGFRGDQQLIGEWRVADGTAVRELAGTSRTEIIPIPGGWVWVDDVAAPELRVSDARGVRTLGSIDAWAIAVVGNRVYADARDGRLRAYDLEKGLLWEQPGGATGRLGADNTGVVCARRDGEADDAPVTIVSYDDAGGERWSAGSYASCRPALRVWGDRVVASGLSLGGEPFVSIFAGADEVVREPGMWTTMAGGMTVDGDAVYTAYMGVLARRERRTWARIEDAWPEDYVRALAVQLDRGLGGKLDDPRKRLRALVKTGSVDELRDAISALRAARRATTPPEPDPIAWLSVAADWPLVIPATVAGPGIPEADDALPDGRIELLHLEGYADLPLGQQRARLGFLVNVRYLSLRMMRIDDRNLGVAVETLPRLEYLQLSENVLERVPATIRNCRVLVHLDLAKNRLRSIDPAELPKTLRFLDLRSNAIPAEQIELVRAALPACEVVA